MSPSSAAQETRESRRLHGYGPPEVLQIRTVPDRPRDKEVCNQLVATASQPATAS